MLARIRVSVPDRPGSLGLVASAVGAAGADVVQVEVLESERGRALDDLYVQVQDGVHLDRLCEQLERVPGVSVRGRQQPAPPVTGHAEIELVSALVAQPQRVLRTLVDGAPAALGADWAALVGYGRDGEPSVVVLISPTCPGVDHVVLRTPLRLSTPGLRSPAGQEFVGSALVPLDQHPLGLVLVRETGPTFHRSELYRLAEIGRVAGRVLVDSDAVAAGA